MSWVTLDPFGPRPTMIGNCPFCGGIAIEYQQGWTTSSFGTGMVRRCQKCNAYRSDTPGSEWCRGSPVRIVLREPSKG